MARQTMIERGPKQAGAPSGVSVTPSGYDAGGPIEPGPFVTSVSSAVGDPPAAGSRPGITRRVLRPMRARRTYWSLTAPDAPALLARVGAFDPVPERVFMVGARTGSMRGAGAGAGAWAHGAPLPPGWSHGDHFLDGDTPAFHFTRDDGARVEVMRAASWYGDGDYGVRDARDAHALVAELVGLEFPGAVLLTTPATTGRELIARTLPHDYEEPVLGDELQELIRATSGQGRTTHEHELAERAERSPTLPHLAMLDCRWAYAALCWGLPAGRPARVLGTEADAIDPMARARWRVRVTVPSDWRERCSCGAPGHAGVGLLGVRDADDGWHYPAAPGALIETWCDGSELKVARDHGWRVEVLDGLVWAASKTRPLDTWARHLARARDAVDGRADVAPEVRAMARHALRLVLLAAIGALLGAPRVITRAIPIADARTRALPTGAKKAGDLLVWREEAASPWRAMSRPEWSACIYGRTRARLLDAPTADRSVRAGALHVPAEHVLAMRTDALYLAGPAPAWPDDGRNGRYVLKSDVAGPVPAPTSTDELRALAGVL